MASSSTAQVSSVSRSPARNVAWCATSAPNTATASALPACRAELNTPPASPARSGATPASMAAVTDGTAKPSPTPSGTSSRASNGRARPVPTAASRPSRPSAATTWPVTIGIRGPYRPAACADATLAAATRPDMGRNISPAASADIPSSSWKYSPSTNTRP